MHDYYKNSIPKLKKSMHGLLKYIRTELEEDTGKSYSLVFDEIWQIYEIRMLEHFPYIGGDKVSGTKNLTGSYCFVAMGEVLKQYGKDMEHIGYLMVLAYTRQTEAMPGIAKMIARKVFTNPKLLKKMFTKKDASNAENAAKYPGSFETKVQEPTSEYPFIYHNLVCPLSDFAKKYGFEEYMPYLCNLDYAMFGALGAPLYRTHTCFADGDYCDFCLKPGAEIFKAWPPVFTQEKGFK